MRKFVAAVVVAVALAVGVVAAQGKASQPITALVGFYAVAGTNPDGSPYKYEVAITETEFGWGVATYFNEGQFQTACGLLRSGNQVAGACTDPTTLMLLKVEGKNKLSGEWTGPQSEGVGREVWTRIPKLTVPVAGPQEHQHPVVGHSGTVEL